MTNISGRPAGLTALIVAMLTIGGVAPALAQGGNQIQGTPSNPSSGDDDLRSIGNGAGRIATQPVNDVGLSKKEIPPALVTAALNPYSLQGGGTCVQIAQSVKALNEALGADYAPAAVKSKENRAGKLAEAGGQTIVNSLIPFRGLVREVSGAASAQRQMNAAVDAGLARRGFLRGLHSARRCKTTF